MKKISLLIIAFNMLIATNAQNKIENYTVSKISTELNKKQITHSINSWQIASIEGDNKVELLIEAIKYSALNSTVNLKGLKISLLSENDANKTAIIYIDDNNYSEIMVVVNQMLTDFKKKRTNGTHGSMVYTTLNGIKFGYNYTENTEVSYLSLENNQSETSCEFKEIDTFLNNFLNFINIASKDLYLPENAEKIKKVKKSNNELKDVIIDDI